MVEKETQIRVLLYGDAFGFACKTLSVPNMLHRHYSEVFSVSEDEVFAYTEKHGIPSSDATSQHSLVEGFHYYQEEGKWYTFFRERNFVHNEKIFEDDMLGRKYIVRTLLQLAGTGLY